MVDRPLDLGGPTTVAVHTGLPARLNRGGVSFDEEVETKEYKPESVIQAVAAANHQLSDRQQVDGEPGEEDEAARRRRERQLVRRPSYRKILTELGGHTNMISEDKEGVSGSESGGSEGGGGEHNNNNNNNNGSHEPRHHQQHQYHQPAGLRVLPSGALISNSGHMESLPNLSMSGSGGGGLVQYSTSHESNNSPFFVPSSMSSLGSSGQGSPGDESNRSVQKREIRLLKNREAARECRRKKKEYIKCLENRVAVLENQNKALIEELKSLKELYTGGKMM